MDRIRVVFTVEQLDKIIIIISDINSFIVYLSNLTVSITDVDISSS